MQKAQPHNQTKNTKKPKTNPAHFFLPDFLATFGLFFCH